MVVYYNSIFHYAVAWSSFASGVKLIPVIADARAVGHDVGHVRLIVGGVKEVGHGTHGVDGHVFPAVGGALLPSSRGVDGVSWQGGAIQVPQPISGDGAVICRRQVGSEPWTVGVSQQGQGLAVIGWVTQTCHWITPLSQRQSSHWAHFISGQYSKNMLKSA